MQSVRRQTSVRRLRRILGVVGGSIATAMLLPELAQWGEPGIGPLQWCGFCVAAAFVLPAIALDRLPAKLLALFCTLFVLAAVVIGAASQSQTDLVYRLWETKQKLVGRQELGIYESDQRLGWAHRAEAVGRHRHYEFDVTYTIDENGFRRTPVKSAEAPRIFFLGGSFVFGQGVEDHETFASQIAARYLIEDRVVNAGVNGWGTVQCWLRLQEVLKQPRNVKHILYGWIPAHAQRNANRRSWLELLGDKRKPTVKVTNGELVFDSLIAAANGVDESRKLEEQERDLSIRLVTDMSRMCRAARVPFTVILLPHGDSGERTDDIAEAWLTSEDVDVFDLRNAGGSYHAHDGHPKPGWHQEVAVLLAEYLQKSVPAGVDGFPTN